MKWNWQQADWPDFKYNNAQLEENEAQFLHQSGILLGTTQHLSSNDRDLLVVEAMSNEALKTSEIEGEYLNRESIQSSIRRHFGLETNNHKIPLAEAGIAEMLVNLYRSFSEPLSHEYLLTWHTLLTQGRRDLEHVGEYRKHHGAMQVISGSIDNLKVHFEAPPSGEVPGEMTAFIHWFNDTRPQGKRPLPALTRAGIAHLYFVCIHPFEDGNGRIGRALSEKALSENTGKPTLVALSRTLNTHRKAYYDALSRNNKDNEITDWLVYFSSTILTAQAYTQKLINFLISKTQFYDRVRGQLNPRQDKVIQRLFAEGLEGFKGCLSAENYIRITQTSRATATRDLKDLVDKQILIKTGEHKSTRYFLNLPQ